jgi:hypothetical protein
MRLATVVASGIAVGMATLLMGDAAEPVPESAAPIKVSQTHRLASGHWMKSQAILSRTGRVDVLTHTWSRSAAAGFHGAVVVFLVDEHDNRLHSTKPRSYGVNSKHLPGDDRSDSFHELVPVDVIARTKGLVIQHLYQPENEILDRLRDAQEASRYLAGILRDGAEILLIGGIH